MYGSVPLQACLSWAPACEWSPGPITVPGIAIRTGAPAAIRCSATSWAPNFVSSYQLRNPSRGSRRYVSSTIRPRVLPNVLTVET